MLCHLGPWLSLKSAFSDFWWILFIVILLAICCNNLAVSEFCNFLGWNNAEMWSGSYIGASSAETGLGSDGCVRKSQVMQ